MSRALDSQLREPRSDSNPVLPCQTLGKCCHSTFICSNSFSCVNEYQATHSGGYLATDSATVVNICVPCGQSLCVNCHVAGYCPEKLRCCSSEQVCQGVNCKAV